MITFDNIMLTSPSSQPPTVANGGASARRVAHALTKLGPESVLPRGVIEYGAFASAPDCLHFAVLLSAGTTSLEHASWHPRPQETLYIRRRT